jgi:RsiW-degrading membrane proteinase PrsW (M82 family)
MPISLSLFCIALATLPSLFWFLFWWFKDNQKEPRWVILLAIIGGILSALVLFPFRYSFGNINWIFLILIAAVSEEILKSLAEVVVVEKYYNKFDQVIDGIIYAVSVAMGFALVENIVYLLEIGKEEGITANFWLTYSVRSIVTTFAHGIFTSIFGFAYALAYLLPDEVIPAEYQSRPFRLSKKIVPKKRYHFIAVWHVFSLHILFAHLFKEQVSTNKHTSNQLILEGIMSAIYVHFLFNLLVKLEIGGKDFSFLLPGAMLILGWAIVSKFAMRRYKKIIHRPKTPICQNWGMHC